MTEDDREAKAAAAMRLVGMQPPQEQQRQQQQVRDLSQMRPVVQQTVAQQEQRAQQILVPTFEAFRQLIDKGADPALKRAFRESNLYSMMG
ncbi:MAG TPA: hypothetical protein VLD37_06190 [Candidatus Bilamarchaeum sp.]|nr:hypothetical protein [Candidatus Bilamarchaeum sp.]